MCCYTPHYKEKDHKYKYRANTIAYNIPVKLNSFYNNTQLAVFFNNVSFQSLLFFFFYSGILPSKIFFNQDEQDGACCFGLDDQTVNFYPASLLD